jgi:hypothetical protein
MAKLIKKGSVSGLELQPDWTIEQDGFGLLTSRLTFRCDADKAANLAPKSGEAHKEDGRLKCHKSTWTINKSGLATVFSDYVGIETGDRTRIQIKGDIVTSTQPIQVHKDFLKVLKDLGWNSQSQTFPDTNAKAVQNAMVGIRSFLSADSSITATYYTSLKSEVNDGVNMVGKTFLKMAGMEDVVLPSGNQGISAFHDRFAMLTGLSYEKFAHLYKVNFSIRISPGGYHNKVYQKQN